MLTVPNVNPLGVMRPNAAKILLHAAPTNATHPRCTLRMLHKHYVAPLGVLRQLAANLRPTRGSHLMRSVQLPRSMQAMAWATVMDSGYWILHKLGRHSIPKQESGGKWTSAL